MSVAPEDLPGHDPQTPAGQPMAGSGNETSAETQAPEAAKRPLHRRVLIICFAIFAFEIGVFLVIFPWMDAWGANNLQDLAPWVQQLWNESYLRGAISGLGLVNIYVAFRQAAGLMRRP